MADLIPAAGAQGYRVLARKYRPKTFADLIGQEALVRTLTNAFATGRIAQAYMLTGVRGIGKTTTARLIARALNYPSGASVEMPEITPQCEAILESRHMDVIEMDAASNTGVDNMREIIDSVRYAPVSVRAKVYIIDEVHMLSKSAFNALLKTLEEPPPHVKFIFATTEIRKVPVTILSRCQRFDLKRLDAALLAQHYANICRLENVEADEEALRMIARAAEGSVRDGLSLLDQAIAYGNGRVNTADAITMLGLTNRSAVIDLFEALMAGDVKKSLTLMAGQHAYGGEPDVMIADLADFTHWVTRLKVAPEIAQQDLSRTEEEKTRGLGFAETLGIAHLSRAWQMLLKGYSEVMSAAQPLQAAEMIVIRLAHSSLLPQGEELAKIIKESASSTPLVRSTSAPLPPQRPQSVRSEIDGALAVAHSERPVATTPAPDNNNTTPRALHSMADIVALAQEKRDIKLRSDLERYIRPVRVSDGQIEVALEAGAPPQLLNELMRKLGSWTGRQWVVGLSKEKGSDSLARQKQNAKDDDLRAALALPDVQAILNKFPGAAVTNVRMNKPLDAIPHPMDETDEEPD